MIKSSLPLSDLGAEQLLTYSISPPASHHWHRTVQPETKEGDPVSAGEGPPHYPNGQHRGSPMAPREPSVR